MQQETMTYDELENAIEPLTYREKFKLAQLLIQLARNEEEQHYLHRRGVTDPDPSSDLTTYVAHRIKKLRPTKIDGLINSINAMFQFRGGISDQDRDEVVADLKRKKIVAVGKNGRISYPDE